MKLKFRPKKVSFLFIMLVIILTLFCINTPVYAQDYVSDSLLKWVQTDDLEAGYHSVTVTGLEGEIVTYNIHLIVLDSDQIIEENTMYGDDNDVATASTYAQNMVIVKVNGDYTINENVTVSPYYTQYGGPKGFFLYVTGTLTNNGIIDNSHGAKAVGENVYLWKNADETFEYVPAVGGSGGASVGRYESGIAGGSGTSVGKRGLGGGGSGGSYMQTSGAGTTGTSYSGGAGGGAANFTVSGKNASPYGGAGGNGSNANDSPAGGGAGNPGGTGATSGSNGTGGLMTIYASTYINKGTITVSGSNGGNSSYGGGSSGGGSLNIFNENDFDIQKTGVIVDNKYNEVKGTTIVTGGATTGTQSTESKGGAGGSGTLNIGQIRNGTYYDLKETIQEDITYYENSREKTGDSILKILEDNTFKTGYYVFTVNGKSYNIHLYQFDGNQEWSENKSFGDSDDIGTSSTYAQNMVVVKVSGNLTINSGVTVAPYYTTYGGPKGFTLFVTGTLTNNGTIDNSHGARAEGEVVYLWKNTDESYEFIPASGGSGGASVGRYQNGNAGGAGSSAGKRGLGGGGSGGSYMQSTGAGTAGTSYSGGTGGGGANFTRSGSAGTNNGRNGGNANGSPAGGGAGNPAGSGWPSGTNGTGGLLTIYANKYINNSTVSAHGYDGGHSSYAGGSSGGGSINIFSYDIVTKGTTNAAGGARMGTQSSESKGGAGGAGTVNYTTLYKTPTLDTLTVNDISVDDFDSSVNNYEVALPEFSVSYRLNATTSDNATIAGLGKYKIAQNTTQSKDIVLTNTVGMINTYQVQVSNPLISRDNSKLEKLDVVGYEDQLNPDYSPLTNEYDIEILEDEIDLDIEAIPYDEDATIKIENNKYLKNNTGTITITVSEPNSEDTIYKINYTKIPAITDYLYDYTENYQTFIAPANGLYRVQLWGAQGGTGATSGTTYYGGKGAYTSGKISLEKNKKLYVYVGGAGSNHGWNTSALSDGGFNGGGAGGDDSDSGSGSDSGGGGGGATDISILAEDVTYNSTKKMYLRSEESYASRIMVAAGGGGGNWNTVNPGRGSNGGGLSIKGYTLYHGTTGYNVSKGSQTDGYAFGYADSGYLMSYGDAKAGGGGGYWTGINPSYGGQGAGGTSYISGHTGSVAVTSSTDISPRRDSEDGECIDGTTDNECSIHYSGYKFFDTKMIDGSGYEWTTVSSTSVVNMPTKDGTSTMIGNSGNGYAKIILENIYSDDNYLDSLISNRGTFDKSFNPLVNEYELYLSKYDETFTLSGELSNESAIVTGLEKYEINPGESKVININVTAETGNIRTYKITATREDFNEGEHTSKLKALEVAGYEDFLTPVFYPLTQNYTIDILSSEINLNINAIAYDEDAIIDISKTTYLVSETGVITITVSAPEVEDTIYTITYNKIQVDEKYNFDYAGKYNVYNVPFTGIYKIELWGAQGGTYNSSEYGGYGGYTRGKIKLEKDKKLYIYIGQQGPNNSASWNGGGAPGNTSVGTYYAGGGATDIRLEPTSELNIWDEFDSLKSRIMVAGAGGGSYHYDNASYRSSGAAAGGLIGYNTSANNTCISYGGTQTSGGECSLSIVTYGSFGKGGKGVNAASGGGSGYYGGAGRYDYSGSSSGGGGGSSFISGHEGSDAIAKSSTSDNIIHTGQSEHYSGYVFEDTQMIDGQGYEWTTTKGTSVVNMPTHDGISTMIGNSGNGYAKITPMFDTKDKNNYLSSLTIDNGILSPAFDPETTDYKLTTDQTSIFVDAVASSNTATVDGIGEIDLTDNNIITITVTSESGDIKTYIIEVNSSSGILEEIKSDIYEVRNTESKIVIGAEIETTIEEFKNNLENDPETINIYDLEGNLLSGDDIVRTGLIIKLEYNNKQYDEAVMAVRGDVDGDGYVNVTDYITVLNHSLEVEDIVDYAKFSAADVEEDELINVTDYIKIMDYSLENIDSLNPERKLTTISSGNISFTPQNTKWNVATVEEALNSLYELYD